MKLCGMMVDNLSVYNAKEELDLICKESGKEF
jgi:hypothetical protein